MAGANFVDYAVIALYALLMVRVGFYVLRFNRGAAEYFRGGRRIPWLVAGLSLQTALAQAKSRSDTSSYTSWWDYTAGALAGALGSQQEADQRFQKALLLPDRMRRTTSRARHAPKRCRSSTRSVRSNQWVQRNIRVALKHELGNDEGK